MSLISLEFSEIIDDKVKKRQIEFSSTLLKEPYSQSSLFVSKVDGQSMQPVILHDALVIADLSQNEYKEDGIFLVYYEDKMWIKKAKSKNDEEFFVSINKEYSHLIYKKEEVRVIAKVLLTFTNL